MTRPAHRILVICASSPPVRCGVGDYSASLCEALTSHAGLTVGLLTTAHSDRKPTDDAFQDFQLLPPLTNWMPIHLWTACRAVSAWRPDLIHIQWPAQGYDGPLAGMLAQWFHRLCRRPVVLTLHEHIPPNATRFGTSRMIANAACAVTSVRPNFCDGFAQGMSTAVIDKPFIYIPNASHIPRASPTQAQIKAFRAHHAIAPEQAVLVYFGLLYPDRGVEHLFDIADPEKHRLFIVGDAIASADSYKSNIAAIASRPPWQGRATLSGFLPANECGLLLALADAVVLPFAHGGGIWNTSLHAARAQGTFVLATSRHEQGYDPTRNVYWAKPGDFNEMRHALEAHLGKRTTADPVDVPSWRDIALQHRTLYERFI